MPGAAAQAASITAGGSAVPVGLFGEVRNTSPGWCLRMASTTPARSRPKSASRAALAHPVAVAPAISGCIA